MIGEYTWYYIGCDIDRVCNDSCGLSTIQDIIICLVYIAKKAHILC